MKLELEIPLPPTNEKKSLQELFWIVILGGPEDLVLLVFRQVRKQQIAMQAMDGQDLHGRRIKVDYATEKRRDGFGSGYGGGGFSFMNGGVETMQVVEVMQLANYGGGELEVVDSLVVTILLEEGVDFLVVVVLPEGYGSYGGSSNYRNDSSSPVEVTSEGSYRDDDEQRITPIPGAEKMSSFKRMSRTCLSRMDIDGDVEESAGACTGNDGSTTVPFDFLIDGELVMSLEEFLLAKELLNAAGSCTHLLEGHTDAITSVCVVKPRVAQNGSDQIVATASKDRTLRLWKFDADESSDQIKRIRAFKILHGHNASVKVYSKSCWRYGRASLHLIDHLKLFDYIQVMSFQSRKGKKDADEEDAQVEEEAKSTLVGHTIWRQDSLNLYCNKVINCLDIGGEGSALIAAGGSDPVLRIYGSSQIGTSAPVYQFSSHSSWISACKWHEKSWFHLVSASYDGKVMLWDLRTADKVLCADWWKGESVISGGADSRLCISSDVCVL
ncbi:hypothetical protein HAX54_039675 [Datura stramonium]|uniref:Ribosome biogenesis protein WDR12 homolog n=1 Tax=Datura stramonium TaxID=4076 RepID=A0ABS8SJ78_DATST|nr:hypothetical protein [Datura stramonium]